MLLRPLTILFALTALAGPAVAGDRRDGPHMPAVDLYGDPLPEGAIARMGSARFRHSGLSSYLVLPDGNTVVTAGGDRLLRYWDLATGKPRRDVLLQGRGGGGSHVTLTPDGKSVLAMLGKQFLIWDAESGREIKRLPVPKNNGIAYVCVAPDGKRLAVGTWGLQTSIIDMQTGAAREITLPRGKAMRPGADSSFHGSFSPDGKWFVGAASLQDPLGIFDAATGREVRRITCSALTSAVSPDSKRLAVSSCQDDKGERATVIRLFDLATGKQTAQFRFAANDSFHALAFAPDGKTLACGFSDHACLLDLATGRVLHRLPGRPLSPTFTRDGKTLIADTGHRLRFWDVATAKELHDYPGDFGSNPVLAVSPDGRLLASGDWMEQVVSLWDATTGRLLRRLPLAGEGRYVRRVAFSPDSKTLVACQGMGYLQFWEAATGKLQRAVQLGGQAADGATPSFYDLHVAPDGKGASGLDQIFTPTGTMSRLTAWDISRDKPVTLGVQTLPGQFRHIAWLAGGRLAVVPRGKQMSMVDVVAGVDAYAFASPARAAPLGVSPDERLVAGKIALAPGVRSDPRFVVWESATGKEVAIVPTDGLGNFALAPDNRCLVTTEYGVVIVRDMATGEVRAPLAHAPLRTPQHGPDVLLRPGAVARWTAPRLRSWPTARRWSGI